MMYCGAASSPQPLLLFLVLLLTASSLVHSDWSAEEQPKFIQDFYNASIYENSRPRTYLASRNLMGIRNSKSSRYSPQSIRFSIMSGDSDGFFTAETRNIGDVTVLQVRTRTGLNDVLNRERKSEYHLTISGDLRSSRRNHEYSIETIVRVEVLDINDNFPLFYESSYDVSVGEDAAIHSSLLMVAAVDADVGSNGKIYYSMADFDNYQFAVHPTTGVVSVTRPLSYLSAAKHKIKILAHDRGVKPRNQKNSLATQTIVNIRVLKVNIHSPKLIVTHLPHVVEHAHANIYAIIRVSDYDSGRNGEIKSVDIVDGDRHRLFNIIIGSKTNEYNLAVLKLLDRELAPTGYNLTIRAVDKGLPSRSSTTNIFVNIVDINDQAPIFLKEHYEEAVSEEAPPYTPVVRVAASDIDEGSNGEVIFRILAGNDMAKFIINSRTGLISTLGWLDAETTTYYSLTVAAIDQASNAQRMQSSAKVIIRVLDGNDNAPTFRTPNTEVTIDENEPSGYYVTRVLASDLDSGENGFVSYSIANLGQVPFTIDPFDGTIRTSSLLDYEGGRRIYTIKVRASDWGQPLKRETETTVKVKIRDINDNRPVFVTSACSGWLDIDAPIGFSIVALKAIDLDAGNRVFYRLREGADNACLALDSGSGVIAVSCRLRERYRKQKDSIVINVTATDGAHISDVATVTLALVDNRKDKTINKKRARVACEESNIVARKEDIDVSARENNEAIETFALFPPRYGYNAHAPDFPPKFPDNVKIYENAAIGSKVLEINGLDHDRGHNGRVVYSISSGDVDSIFKIDIHTGVVKLVAPLDRERNSRYNLTLTLYDLGQAHRSTSKRVRVDVLDINDNAPEFSQLSYNLHLPENTKNGTSVAQLLARDIDEGVNGEISYELVSRLKEFSLNPINGILSVTGFLDREIRDEYDLRVRAWDNAPDNPRSTMARVIVTIMDINDCIPNFGAGKYLRISIPEDIPRGAVVATIQASDEDLGPGGRILYSFVSGHGKDFVIDSDTGIVRVSSSLDFETRQIYNITVLAEDHGHPSLSSNSFLFIQVSDVDENQGPPKLSQRVIETSLEENKPAGTLVETVQASDPDGGKLTFSIVAGTGRGIFTINGKGEVRTLKRLDRETSNGFWLTITVSDHGTVPLSDTCHMYIRIVDLNDNLPQTEHPVYRPKVSENSRIGTTVASLVAFDHDLSSEGGEQLRFAVSKARTRRNNRAWMGPFSDGGEEAADVFRIDERTGIITTMSRLDRELHNMYSLWISVTDGLLSTLTPVFVTVEDLNDNSPEFLEKVYRFDIPARKRARRKEPVFRVFASDPDFGKNGAINYSLKNGRGRNRFKIDEATGRVYATKGISPGQTYDLTVKATDNGSPRLSSTAHVLVRVVDVPSKSANAPIVEHPPTAHVMETDPPGHVLSFINAQDSDNDTLWFSITGGDPESMFHIGLDTGVVSLARQLDREKYRNYNLIVEATDGDNSASTKLNVKVLDSNDNPPQFTEPVYETLVPENVKPGASLVRVHCSDRDLLAPSQSEYDQSNPADAAYSISRAKSTSIFYSIHHAQSPESLVMFSLDETSGVVSLAKPLDRELSSLHSLTIMCTDPGGDYLEDMARVVITVSDFNDHDPEFLESIFEAKISEGAAIGSLVARVTAVDHDQGENGRVSYSIVEGNQGGTFSINSDLGYITVAQSLLQKGGTEFLLLIRAMDHSAQPRATSVPVRVLVASSLDVPPSWELGKMPKIVEVSEWAPINSVIAMVTAVAPPSLSYDIPDGNSDLDVFSVSPSSGVLLLKIPLDYEANSWYNLTIRATNTAGVSSSTWLGVRVIDENDFRPEWTRLEYVGVVVEDALPGDLVLDYTSESDLKPLTISALDKDSGKNARVTYSIIERGAVSLFAVDEFTGAFRVSSRLDSIAGRTFYLSVWARDGGNPKRECLVPAVVKIIVNKVRPRIPAFLNDQFSATIYKPTIPGVKILCTGIKQISFEGKFISSEGILSTHQSSALEYSIAEGNTDDAFKIDGGDGCIYVSKPVDMNPSYNITLAAYGEGGTSKTNVLIKVEDVPVGSLKFMQDAYWANVLENTTNPINILAVSIRGLPLNHHVTYSILNPNDYFEIRSTSGVLKSTGKAFDREKQDYYALIIEAREVSRPQSFGHVTVHVAVLDVNDNEPVFVGQPYEALVTTKAERGHVIFKVRAVDADKGSFGAVRYELVRGSGELFKVGKLDGSISLKQPLVDQDKTFSLTVAAYDGGKQPLSSQAHILIRVVSAEGPIFPKSFYESTIFENKESGTPVSRIEAKSAAGGEIIYSILTGDPDGDFDLEYKTGVIRLSRSLDFERVSQYNLTIRAKDPFTGMSSDAHLNVILQDVNDNAPVFKKIVFRGEVSEAAIIGKSVLKVQASDADSGLSGSIRYSCDHSCGNFTIHPESGVVSVAGELDAEERSELVYQVVATDMGLPPMSSTAKIVITVLDFNDNPPEWIQDTYHAQVSTEAKAGHVVTSLFARDRDISNAEGQSLHYHIHAGDSNGAFSLDSDTGLLSVTAPHHLTMGSTVNLNVSATDGVHAAFTTVRVKVMTDNQNSPRFSQPLYECSLEENLPPGKFVTRVSASDADAGVYGRVTYSILGQERRRMFRINEEGEVYTEVPLDREMEPVHNLIVSALDVGGKSGFTSLRVSVLDTNDNSPRFSIPEYQANIGVDTVVGNVILKVSAFDPDEGENSAIRFSLYESDNSEALELFSINNDGELILKRSVEGRENEVFQFFLRASDGGSPEKVSDAPITIFLLNIHEKPPKCARKYAQFFLPEDAQIGTVVTTLWVSGPMEIKYSILSDELQDNHVGETGIFPFEINHNGELTVKRHLDHETNKMHRITIVNQTITTPPVLDYMTINVVVMDINDCSPHFSSSSYDVIVAENSLVGAVVTTLSATDADDGNNGQVQYAFKNDTSKWLKSMISIDPHSGSIGLKSPLDRESIASFSFNVVAMDNGPNPLFDEAVVNIYVEDYNDNPPVFDMDIYVTNVPEDTLIGTVIVELSLKDDDDKSESLDFFIMGGENSHHFLVHALGQVYVARPLDREKQDHYTLIVTATDGKFSANTTVSVAVIDVNDNGPVCTSSPASISLPEDAPSLTYVSSITTWDSDIGSNARTRFSLEGAGSEDFRIDTSGKISTKGRLDRETKDLYHFVAVASDWEEPQWRCESSVTVSVTDVNDNSPEFPHKELSISVAEDAPVNTVLTRIKAIDSDMGENRRVHYSLLSGTTESSEFAVDPMEGVITLTYPLDREAKDSYKIEIEARDNGSPSLASTVIVLISVTDVNDNPPEFVRTLQQVTVDENIPVGSEISRVMATSRDIGINAEIVYSLEHTTQEEYLKIHPKTGVISVHAILDYEKVQVVVATVLAVDMGEPPLTATALLNVTITDLNDNPPVFTSSNYMTEVKEDERIGRTIIQVTANDADCGANGNVVYEISSGNENGHFSIESDRGYITLAKGLDREKKEEYMLEITASDRGVLQNSALTLVHVTLLDVNDNPPVFVSKNYSAIVQENRPVGYSVLRLSATDKDSGSNGPPFTWEMVGQYGVRGSSSTSAFTLDQGGVVRLATNRLDHRIRNSYKMSVRVWDSGSPPLSADTIINITVVEESRYPPTLYPLYANVISYLSAFPGGIIGKISALDQDPYDTLEYSILESKKPSMEEEYFRVDKEDGVVVALSPLDSGTYSINVSVSDGKFKRVTKASIEVFVIDDDMIDRSVIVRIGSMSPNEFLSSYKKVFKSTLALQVGIEKFNLQILGIQKTFSYRKYRARTTRDIKNSLDILLIAKKNDGTYYSRNSLMRLLDSKMDSVKDILSLPSFSVIDSVCSPAINCSSSGKCVDAVQIIDGPSAPINTKLDSLVTPRFMQVGKCKCDQGFDGDRCQNMVNACGRKPCFEFEQCIPSTSLSRGYSCRCPEGKAGPRCDIDRSLCKEPSCHYPEQPFSFKGKSYAQYSIGRPFESSSFQLSTFFRTRYPVGVIIYTSGEVDYSILEVSGGYLQYRWDCGSGEGLVRVPHNVVNDDKWHFINLTREGTVSKLSVDGKMSSGAAPGVHDILNIHSDSLFVGAKVRDYTSSFGSIHGLIEYGFVGCVDMLKVNGGSLPVVFNTPNTSNQLTLKRLANVELRCPIALDPPGVCGSHPCINGGTCNEEGTSYSCTCPPRFVGRHCEFDTAPCSSSPCLNNGQCFVVVKENNYVCRCPPGISGKRCEYGVFCEPNPCKNGGRCEEGAKGAICKCQHFTGNKCEMDIDECTRNPCQNGGTCLNLYGGFRCLCTSNTSGEYCSEKLIIIEPGSNFSMSYIELLLCILAVVLTCIIPILLLVYCQRRRKKNKRQQQNNSVKLMGHHVKNDLKSSDIPKRNSKICNVEADQQLQGHLLPRPSSFTPSGTDDSALYHTLKHLADLSACEQETLELNSLPRRTGNDYADYAHNYVKNTPGNPSKCSPSPPPILVSSAENCASLKKPWDHHNNLNESYFAPSKDVGFVLPPNLEETPRGSSPGLNSSYSDNSSADPSAPLVNLRKKKNNRETAKRFPPLHKNRVYRWDEYDLRGSSPLLTFGPNANRATSSEEGSSDVNNEADPLLSGVSENLSITNSQAYSLSTPLLQKDSTSSGSNLDHKEGGEKLTNDKGVKESFSFEEVLMENNISLSSNECLSEKSSQPYATSLDNLPFVKYNIVSESKDQFESEEKISNIPLIDGDMYDSDALDDKLPDPSLHLFEEQPKSVENNKDAGVDEIPLCPPPPPLDLPIFQQEKCAKSNEIIKGRGSSSKSICNGEPSLKETISPFSKLLASPKQVMKTCNGSGGSSSLSKFGNPRSRRPFNRSDYGRMSDISFLSNMSEDSQDTMRRESFSDAFTDDCIEDEDNECGKDVSKSEVYL